MNRLLNRDKTRKPRLYMAMYVRATNGSNDVQYHTALLLSPKNPDVQKDQSVRYHVKNVIVGGIVTWVFSSEVVQNRTTRLVSTTLLGKIAIPEANLRTILENVPVVQGDSAWLCHHWVWDAIQTLINERIIVATGLPPQALWNVQYAFSTARKLDFNLPLPCIDSSGNEITSEIPPLQSTD